MKRIIIVLVTVLIAIAITACGMYHIGHTQGQDEIMSHVYPMIATVIQINRIDDAVIVEDDYNHQWVFMGCDDWCEGDIAALIMDDNGTELIYDDIIMDVKYIGWVE